MKRTVAKADILQSFMGNGIEVKERMSIPADPFSVAVYANPLTLDASTNKDFICASVTGNTTVNLTNASNGDAGLIELIIDIVGGYTVALGTMFTKDISGVAIDTTASVDNFISWRKVGTDIVYSIAQVQS